MASNVRTAVMLTAALMTLQVVQAFTASKLKLSATGESAVLVTIVRLGAFKAITVIVSQYCAEI